MKNLHGFNKIILLFAFYSPLLIATEYQVEVLIFETKDKNALNEEWPLSPGEPSLTHTIDLDSPSANIAKIPEKDLTLQDAKRRLQKNYRIIAHQGWMQPIVDKKRAQKIHLFGGKIYNHSSFGEDEHEMDGFIRLSNNRHFYVETDLIFKKPTLLNSDEQPYSHLQAFRLKQTLPIKLNQVHYIDHPLYGIIIVVRSSSTKALPSSDKERQKSIMSSID